MAWMWSQRALACWLLLGLSTAQDCTFDYQVDPYTEYYGLNPDYTAYSSDDCKNNCCADPTCDVYQYTYMPPVGGANCMWGVSSDYGDSGGVQYEGEQGRDDGGGGDDPGGGGGGKKNHAKCIGPHCAETPYGLLLVIGFGCASMVYLVAGTYFGYQQGLSGTAALPNSYFWANLGGLVKDGIAFTASGGKTTGTPPGLHPGALLASEVAEAKVEYPADAVTAPAPARRKKPRPAGGVPEGKRRVKKPTGGADGKKKVRKKKPAAAAGPSSGASME